MQVILRSANDRVLTVLPEHEREPIRLGSTKHLFKTAATDSAGRGTCAIRPDATFSFPKREILVFLVSTLATNQPVDYTRRVDDGKTTRGIRGF